MQPVPDRNPSEAGLDGHLRVHPRQYTPGADFIEIWFRTSAGRCAVYALGRLLAADGGRAYRGYVRAPSITDPKLAIERTTSEDDEDGGEEAAYNGKAAGLRCCSQYRRLR